MGNSVNTNRMKYRTRDPLSHENFRNAKRASLSTKTSIRGKVDAIGPTTIAQTVTMPRVQPKYGKFSRLGRNKIGHYFRIARLHSHYDLTHVINTVAVQG